MNGIHPSMQFGGAVERPGNRPGAAVPTAEATTTGSTTVTDEVTLSPEAKAFIASSGPGHARAHEARALIADIPELAGKSFGQIVSGLNHGVDFAAMFSEKGSEVPADGTEKAAVAPATDTPDATAATTEEVSSLIAPITTGDAVPPVADGSDDVVVVAPATDVAAGTGTATDDVLVASTGLANLDMFPDLEPYVEIDTGKSLLEELTETIEEFNDQEPDGSGGVDIAA